MAFASRKRWDQHVYVQHNENNEEAVEEVLAGQQQQQFEEATYVNTSSTSEPIHTFRFDGDRLVPIGTASVNVRATW